MGDGNGWAIVDCRQRRVNEVARHVVPFPRMLGRERGSAQPDHPVIVDAAGGRLHRGKASIAAKQIVIRPQRGADEAHAGDDGGGIVQPRDAEGGRYVRSLRALFIDVVTIVVVIAGDHDERNVRAQVAAQVAEATFDAGMEVPRYDDKIGGRRARDRYLAVDLGMQVREDLYPNCAPSPPRSGMPATNLRPHHWFRCGRFVVQWSSSDHSSLRLRGTLGTEPPAERPDFFSLGPGNAFRGAASTSAA